MNDIDKESGTTSSWLDWLLYFGSQDERHRSGADRAGHLAFWFAFVAATVDFVVKLPAFKAEADLAQALGMVALNFAVILGGGLVYAWNWIRAGVTFTDTPLQRRLLKWLAPLAGVGAALSGLIPWGSGPESWSVKVFQALALGVVAWLATVWLYRWQDAAARRQSDKLEAKQGD